MMQKIIAIGSVNELRSITVSNFSRKKKKNSKNAGSPSTLKKDEYDRFKKNCVDEPAFFEIFFSEPLGKSGGKNFFSDFRRGKKKKFFARRTDIIR